MHITVILGLLARVVLILLIVLGLTSLSWLVGSVAVRPVRPPRLRLVLRAAVQVAVLILLILAASNYYVYHGFGYQGDIYRRGNPNQPWVAITFDDGPSAEFTPAILDILKQYDVPATFFMVGDHVRKYPEIAQRVVDEGHEVGNHTYTHINVPTASARRLTQELFHTTQAIVEATGVYPIYSRPPRGLYDSRYRRLSQLLGQSVVLWTLSARDWQVAVNADQVIRRVLREVKAGDIVLFHDSGALIRHEGASRQATVQALPAVIEGIRAKGLEIVPLSRLLRGAEPEVDEEIILDHQE